jgi:hypothetical protein
VAKQQQVEDEIEALCRHQDQIRALKARLTKLSAKCNAETRKDQPSNESAHRMAGMILNLADKLDVQVCNHIFAQCSDFPFPCPSLGPEIDTILMLMI